MSHHQILLSSLFSNAHTCAWQQHPIRQLPRPGGMACPAAGALPPYALAKLAISLSVTQLPLSAATHASNPTHHTLPLPLPPRKPASTAPDTTIWPANLALKPHPRDHCPAARWQWGCRTASSGRRPSQRSLRAAHLGNVGGNRIPAMAHANRTTFGQAPECTTYVLLCNELTPPRVA